MRSISARQGGRNSCQSRGFRIAGVQLGRFGEDRRSMSACCVSSGPSCGSVSMAASLACKIGELVAQLGQIQLLA